MSKKKRSKILATLLCATTMAAFYASPQIGYAVSLNQKEDGTVTTDSGGTNTAIHNIEGIESITFGVQGDMETGGVNLYFDGTGTYGGLVANGSLTATDLYITVENNADGDNYNSNRYSLKNALGIHRTGTGDKAITNIEANSQGHGGMQVSSDTVSILDGAAVFTNKTTSDNGGTISFSSAFNSEQGMTVGTNFVLDSTGKISKVNGIDVQGALTTTGTINSMTIGNNQVNGVTLNNGNVTANEVTVGSYKLSEVGSLANTINQKTMGIASYDASNGTTFNGKITAYAGVVTNSISDGSVSFRVSDAKDVIDAVNDSGTGLEATNDLAKENEKDIVSLGNKVDTFDGRITKNTNDIGTLNTKTTGMSYDASSGTTFAQAVTANDFKIGDTSLKNVADAVNNETSGLAAAHTKIGAAESEIDTLQKVTTGMSYDASSGTKFAQDVTANDFKIAGGTSLSQVATDLTTAQGKIQTNTNNITTLTGKVTTAESKIDVLQTTVGDENSGLVAKTKNLNADGSTLTGMTNITTNTFTATSGSIGSIGFSGNNLTNVASIGGVDNTVTVAGTAIGNGSFNGVTIADYNTNGSHGATINGISIYQDSDGHYNVGTIDLNDLTGSGSGGTVDGIVRTDNTPQDKEDNDYTTTIEGNLEVRTNGTITQRNGDFAVAADGTVTGKDFAVKGTGTTLSGVAGNVTTLTGRVDTAETDIDKLQTTVGDESSGLVKNVNDLNTTVSGHTTSINDLTGRVGTAETNIDTLQTTVGNEKSGLVKKFNDLNTTVSGHTTSINDLSGRVGTAETNIGTLQTTVGDENSGLVQSVNTLNSKTVNLSDDGSTLTGMTNITTNTFTATSGSIGSIGFSGNNLTNVASIGGVDNTVTVAGTAISNGSFNGVNISVDRDSHATFNGVSIYKDANDYIVGDVNISALKGVSGTEIEGIKRTSNNGGGFTTTIEENLAVSTDGTIKQTNGDFAVDTDGNVTGKDFKVNGTSLGDVASAVNDQTKGLKATYDIASANQAAITDEETGLGALNNKTTGMTYTAGTTTADGITEFDHKLKATAFETENLTATEGNIGGISFETVNGVKTIGTDSDTITLAGNAISKGSFNGVSIGVDGSNRATFNGVSIYTDSANENDVMVGGINISDLQSGSAEITNKLRGITYSNESGNDYTMTFAGVMSVSTEGEYKFKYNGNEYGLDDLINTVSSEDLAGFEELKKKVDKLEDKTTGIEFDEGTGSTTINDMDKDSSGNWVKGDNSLTVGDDGITANGDTVINGDTDDNTTGGNGNDSNDPQGGDSIINGDQLVNGDQHVTGDSQFDGTITVGSGTDDKGQTVIDGGNITTGDTIIDGGSVTSKEGHFDNINVGSGENATTIGESGIQVGDNTTIDNSGVSIKDENGSVVMGDHDVVIKDSDGNVEASLSDVANRVDGIEQSIGDLNSRMGELEDRIDKVGAMAAAIANLRTMGYDPAAPTEVAVGIGQYRNETGAALGLFHYPNRDFMLSLSVSTSGNEVMGGIGATWKFGRKSPEKVAAEKAEKAREAKLQKAEAIKEAARLKKIEAQQERHAKLAAQKTATK